MKTMSKYKLNALILINKEILAKYFSDCTLMKTSTGYWASSALAAILTDCLLNPNTYLQNLKFIFSVGQNNLEGGKQDFRICIEFYLRFVTSVILPPAKKYVTP